MKKAIILSKEDMKALARSAEIIRAFLGSKEITCFTLEALAGDTSARSCNDILIIREDD